ncbi:hypothetical protein N9344_00140 [bacterium]|nr:hypothetical protein [bacterium]
MLFGFIPHKYYVSVTDMAYNEKEQSLEASIKFIGHDFEKALINAGVPELDLGAENENKKADDYIQKYLSKHFTVTINDEILPIKLIGKEVKSDDDLYCYIEIADVKKIKSIKIKNALLMEIFSAQHNILYLKLNDKKYNFNFNKDKKEVSINLKKD